MVDDKRDKVQFEPVRSGQSRTPVPTVSFGGGSVEQSKKIHQNKIFLYLY